MNRMRPHPVFTPSPALMNYIIMYLGYHDDNMSVDGFNFIVDFVVMGKFSEDKNRMELLSFYLQGTCEFYH